MDVTNIPTAAQTPEQLSKAPAPHLVNHGGKILETPKFVSIFYGPYWNSTEKGKSDAGYLNQFGNYLVDSPHMGTWAEYGVKSASYGGSTFTKGTPQRVIDEHDVQQIVWDELRGKTVSPADGETVYTVYLPPGVELRAPDDSSSFDGLGGYHGSMLDHDGTPIYYAAIVYSQGENGIPFSEKPRDNITITASHEWTEAATDPDVNRSRIAWYDKNYGEVGDIPIAIGLPVDDIWGRLGGYAIQREWSNRDNVSELVPRNDGSATAP